ncbi:hypothetical protein OAN59_11345, partial [Alphaproteobacteria bacterium]|nr:hypothetical protein [Alphaproteobacteria bacterium]
DKPSGPCGEIRLDRFEVDGESKLGFWNYISRKAITNPNGKSGAVPCNKLDEEIYSYSWKPQSVDLECIRLELTAF